MFSPNTRAPLLITLAALALLCALATGCSTDRSAGSKEEAAGTSSAKLASGEQPVEGALEGVEIAGYCPVAYVAANKPVRGVAEHPADHQGRTYWFVDEGAREAFVAAPEKFQVMYRGWCATALAQGALVASDPTIFRARDGKIYLFANEDAASAFDADPKEIASRAEAAWREKQ